MKRAILAAFALAVTWTATLPAAIIYTNRTVFENDLGTVITDDYGTAYPDGFAVYNNATMNGFFGETEYFTTGWDNWNILNGDTYCAGCNGSFRLTFTSTSVSGTNGVFGVGFDKIVSTYVAYVTFGDNSTQEFTVPNGIGFWGITSPLEIQTIHFGLSGGGATTGGSFRIDNLTIGNPVPEPSTWSLLGAGLLALGAVRRKS